MNNTDLAEFYGVTDRAVRKWSPERKHRKRIQALANAEQPICDLIADISKLVFIFNCKSTVGSGNIKCQEVTVWHDRLMITGTEFWQDATLDSLDAVNQLQSIKTKLEELVYGVSSVD